MKPCFICRAKFQPYFSKEFNAYSLGRVEYVKCENCGLVVSQTHFQLSEAEWERLNHQYHSEYLGTQANKDDPRWLERLHLQRSVIEKLYEYKLIPHHLPWLDYGCGDGKLSELLAQRQIPILNFDRYMNRQLTHRQTVYLTETELHRTKYDLVVNTSVFEHVRGIEPLDEMNSLVSAEGTFAIHTWVGASVPADPNWFYLLPVHCAFYTNKGMQILFDRWGYTSSIYHVSARLWLFFRSQPVRQIQEVVAHLNAGVEQPELYFREGFMDYWS